MDLLLQSDLQYESANLYFQDESRFGLHTQNGKMLTKAGVKPICKFQQKFESTYLFGAFSPIDGDTFLTQMPSFNTQSFQVFLDQFAQQLPCNRLNILVLDNAAVHKAKALVIPQNLKLLFLPPYSPELNPTEKIWATLKRNFSNQLFNTMDDIYLFFEQQMTILSKQKVISITNFKYISSNIEWTI